MGLLGRDIFERRPDVQFADELGLYGDEFDALRQADSGRLSLYHEYRKENTATRAVSPTRAVGGNGASDYGNRRDSGSKLERHNIPLPFGQATTVKHAYRIAGRLPDVVVDRRGETPQERYRSDAMEKIVWGILRESKGEAQIATAAWDGSSLGASCFEVYFDIGKQLPCIRALDPAGVIVVKGVQDPHAFQRVYRFWDAPLASVRAEYRNATFRGEPVQVDKIRPDAGEDVATRVTIVQVCDPKRTTRFTLRDRVGLYEYEHNYGFCNNVVIPNLGPDRDVWGFADYEFIRALSAYIQALFGREADILRSVANGAYTESGTGLTGAAISDILAKGGVIPVKREGKVEPISTPDVPAFEAEHSKTALSFFKMLSFTPDAAWGDGSAGSGSDRGLQLQPQLEFTALKQINWSAGLSRLFAMAYQMIERKQVGNATYRGVRGGVGGRRSPFTLQLGPDLAADQQPNPAFESDPEVDEFIDLPRTPKDLFDGDYEVRFTWQNRVDPDDPAYVMSELNKFAQGAQSLRTTLERLGVQAPEDEMTLIEQEAERFPWLRQGMIAFLRAQLAAQNAGGGGQGAGGGAPVQSDLSGGLDSMLTKDGSSLDAPAGASALPGGLGTPYGGN